ncbi:UDP-N-acetylmuramate dehydrogenase [Persephonella atlantica]|uniref:UDP-N-acetylenolpyruvoylglucosamine reductase n=1 Tax=Persephonella atlantica TaxID=2699429 RepID=A0ABS1GF47_9AQUI|nr:UDP-N-acetylmuramate dehydrogenase [Persephonella atlantica]MBK3331513.1 UDP-N-acetylmuramate dehydrogenase [Persephonella atlantica]
MSWINFEEFADLSKLCTIRIGGKARKLYIPKNVEEVKNLLTEASLKGKKLFPVGIGSNTVFSDGLLEHFFVLTRELRKTKTWRERENFFIEAEAGVSFKTILSIVRKYNLEGFENLSGIPATVGGATVMNAGAYGTEMSDILERVYWISPQGNLRVFERDEIPFSYRYSPFHNNGFVYKVVIKLKASKKDIRNTIKKLLEDRNRKQPLNYPTSGSTFKNPIEKSAGYLLEKSGMKGYRIGDVAFSHKHANFLINMGSGKFKDLKRLIETAEKRVGELYQIKLEREIEIVE